MATEITYKNVTVRPRMETYSEWFEAMLNAEIEQFKKDKASPYVRGYENITVDEYTENCKYSLGLSGERLYWDRCPKWYVFFPNGRIVKIDKRKCGETNEIFAQRLDRTIAKVEKENTTDYGRFSAVVQQLINKSELRNSFLVYPTNYGIGLWAIYNWNFDEQAKQIENVLENIGISYSTEYSDARWVFRYKLSKTAENKAVLESYIR